MQQFYSRSPSVVSRLVGGETLIVPVRSGVGDLASIYTLNEVGSFLWGNLERAATLPQLAALVAREFEVEPDRAELDLAEFLKEMNVAGLVAVAEEVAGDPVASCVRGATS